MSSVGKEIGDMRCSSCAAEVNPLHESCPSCGASTDWRFDKPSSVRSTPGAPSELKRNRRRVLTVVAGLLVLSIASQHLRWVSLLSLPHDVRVHSLSTPAVPAIIGASALFEAYHTDSQSADRRFGGREM